VGPQRTVLGRHAVAVGIAAFALAGLTISRPAAATTKSPSVMTCVGTTVVKPKAYTIACADANSYLSKLHWTVWVTGDGRATGTFTENSCTPDCAAGKFISHQAKIALSGARSTAHGLLYTRLSLSYTASGKLQHFSTTLPTTPL
jgi:hypothetical protein